MKPAKRLFDIFWSGFGLLLLWPLFAIIALLIKLDDGGPVFFRQTRVGYSGDPFRMWKFRTMVVDAERLGKPLTVADDRRITRAGRWLRKLKLDELPQLINVVKGEMSLVGPRPEVSRYVELYTQDQRKILHLVPGITDPASIRYRNEDELLSRSQDPETTYIEELLPEKIRLNLEYAARASVWTDFLVVFSTLERVFLDRND